MVDDGKVIARLDVITTLERVIREAIKLSGVRCTVAEVILATYVMLRTEEDCPICVLLHTGKE